MISDHKSINAYRFRTVTGITHAGNNNRKQPVNRCRPPIEQKSLKEAQITQKVLINYTYGQLPANVNSKSSKWRAISGKRIGAIPFGAGVDGDVPWPDEDPLEGDWGEARSRSAAATKAMAATVIK